MVKPDVCDDAAVGTRYDVRRVIPPAEADLNDRDIAVLPRKPQQSRGGHHLKLRRVLVHRVGNRLYLLYKRRDLPVLYHPAVYLHPLVEAAQIRRGEKPRFEPRLFEYGGKHRGYAALAVGARDVDISQFLLRIAQTAEQLAYAPEPEP